MSQQQKDGVQKVEKVVKTKGLGYIVQGLYHERVMREH
jgi:hypothetical protein